ncbi:MAG: hypothetical protein ACTSU2_07755 [Promethearchaeota archaeon]
MLKTDNSEIYIVFFSETENISEKESKLTFFGEDTAILVDKTSILKIKELIVDKNKGYIIPGIRKVEYKGRSSYLSPKFSPDSKANIGSKNYQQYFVLLYTYNEKSSSVENENNSIEDNYRRGILIGVMHDDMYLIGVNPYTYYLKIKDDFKGANEEFNKIINGIDNYTEILLISKIV